MIKHSKLSGSIKAKAKVDVYGDYGDGVLVVRLTGDYAEAAAVVANAFTPKETCRWLERVVLRALRNELTELDS